MSQVEENSDSDYDEDGNVKCRECGHSEYPRLLSFCCCCSTILCRNCVPWHRHLECIHKLDSRDLLHKISQQLEKVKELEEEKDNWNEELYSDRLRRVYEILDSIV